VGIIGPDQAPAAMPSNRNSKRRFYRPDWLAVQIDRARQFFVCPLQKAR
jgi:hypothetical protein